MCVLFWIPFQFCVPVIWVQTSFQFRRCRSCHNWHNELCTHILLSLPSSVCLLDVPVHSLKFCIVTLPQVRCGFYYSCNGFRNVFHMRNNDHWPLRRITLLFGLLVPFGLNLAPHFVESPLRIPARPKGLFYIEIFLFSVFNLCNEAITSFQQKFSPHSVDIKCGGES